jgi:AcrR family transcriptional regulator
MTTRAPAAKGPEATQRKILEAAFAEFYKHGFQGGSLNQSVEAAGTTKGALFHHSAGKQELGYAVVDEIIGPILEQRWLAPLADSTDPIAEIKRVFRHAREDVRSGGLLQGCPPTTWRRKCRRWTKASANGSIGSMPVAQALRRGACGRNDAGGCARCLAAQSGGAAGGLANGHLGTGRARRATTMIQACEALCGYLRT